MTSPRILACALLANTLAIGIHRIDGPNRATVITAYSIANAPMMENSYHPAITT